MSQGWGDAQGGGFSEEDGGGGRVREEGFVRRGEGCDQNAKRIRANK